MIQDLERGVKSKLQKLFEAATRTHVGQAVTYYPVTMRQQRPCVVCGVNLPLGIQNCPSCGAVQVITRPSPPSRRNGSETQTLDQRVFDYIVAHAGTISLSQAAQDLSMSPDALRLTIERLKAAGLLSQA